MSKVDVAVVGGGIAGLSTALGIRRLNPSLKVRVIESRERPGGNLHTERADGFICERGPASIRIAPNDSALTGLLEELALEPQFAQASASRRFVVKEGRLVPLGPGILLGGALLPLGARLRLCAELFSAAPPGQDESLADFGRRRLGPAVVENLLAPMCKGIFGGDPEELSLASAFPSLAELDRGGGITASLLRPWRRKRKARVEILSFPGGLSSFIDALAQALGTELSLSTKVESFAREEESSRLELRGPAGTETVLARHVVLAVPAFAAAELLRSLSPTLSAELEAIPYADLIVVGAGYPKDAVSRPLNGFGALVGPDSRPEGTRLRALGYLESSSVFADRSPEGARLYRVMLGGRQGGDLLDLSDEELTSVVRRELEAVIGASGEPRFWRIFRHRRGIPQYVVGHGDRLARIEALKDEVGGLELTGNAYRGPGIADTLRDAHATASRVASFLAVSASQLSPG